MENAGLRERLMQRERSAAYIDLHTKAAYIEADMDAKRMRALPCVAASDAAALAVAAGMGYTSEDAATRVADEAKAAASALGYQNAAEAASLEDADDLPCHVKTAIDASAAAAAAAATAERAARAEEERWRRPPHSPAHSIAETQKMMDEDAEIATQWAVVVSMAQSALTAAATQEGIAVERAGGPLIVAHFRKIAVDRGRPAAAAAAAAAAAPAEQTAEASLQAIRDRLEEAFEPIEAFLATAAAEPIAEPKARPKAKLSSKRKQPTA